MKVLFMITLFVVAARAFCEDTYKMICRPSSGPAFTVQFRSPGKLKDLIGLSWENGEAQGQLLENSIQVEPALFNVHSFLKNGKNLDLHLSNGSVFAHLVIPYKAYGTKGIIRGASLLLISQTSQDQVLRCEGYRSCSF